MKLVNTKTKEYDIDYKLPEAKEYTIAIDPDDQENITRAVGVQTTDRNQK